MVQWWVKLIFENLPPAISLSSINMMLSNMLTLNKENINFRRGEQLNSKGIVTKVNLI